MSHFDRFDICAAYNLYAVDYCGDRYANAIGCRLSRLQYKPSQREETVNGLSENAKEIYGSLVRRENRLYTAYERLYRKSRGAIPSWPGWHHMPRAERQWLKSIGLLEATESMVST